LDQQSLTDKLLEDQNVFESVRVGALAVLREAITSPSSIVLVPALLERLGPILFEIPTSTRPDPRQAYMSGMAGMQVVSGTPLQLGVDEIIGTMWPAWLTECANVLRLWLEVDRTNASGIRDSARLAAIDREWVEPQTSRLASLQKDAQDVEAQFVLARWLDALERLIEEIRVLGGR
jgi:hypothetical protein